MLRSVDTYLETERLALRRFTVDDAGLLIELDSDPAVMRYLTGGEATAPEDVRDRALPSIIAGYGKWGGDLGLFAAHERDGGAFVGWFCLRPEADGPRDEAELGYRLRQASWGQGYATEGSRALLHKGFTGLGLRTVWAATMVVNRGSRPGHGETRHDARGRPPHSPRHGAGRGFRARGRAVRDHQGAVGAALTVAPRGGRVSPAPRVIGCGGPAGVGTVPGMDVTFTKLAGRRYRMAVVRERGPELAPRQGPGYDDYLPHDAVHFLVEAEAGLAAGVFGRIAAGRSNLFWAADPAVRKRQARREAKRSTSRAEHADMARSESLASVCEPLWKLRAGQRSELPDWFSSLAPDVGESPLVERILARLDAFATTWNALPPGGTVTLSWQPGRGGR